MSNSEKKFSEAVKEWRTLKGLSQKEVAKRMGIGRTTISFLENGEQQPSTRHLILFKEKWGVDFSDAILGEPAKPHYGPPTDSELSHQAFVDLFNANKEAKKDLILATQLLERISKDLNDFPPDCRKLINELESFITSAWKKL